MISEYYRRIGLILPSAVSLKLQKKIRQAGRADDAPTWFGGRLLVALAASSLVIFLPLILSAANVSTPIVDVTLQSPVALIALGLALSALCATLILASYYLSLYYAGIERAEKVEKVLPDFLLIVSSNLRAGMTPFNAFKRAALPELGPLEREIQLASTKASSSQSLSQALTALSERFDSEVLERTVDLFDKSVRSGGQIADLLTAISEEVRRGQELRKELITSTQSYTLFLFFIILVITPALLAVSVQFLKLYSDIRSQTTGESLQGFSLPFFGGKMDIGPDFVTQLAYVALTGTSLFSSVLMGVISRGKYLYGLKYFPFLTLGAFLSFSLALQATSGILAAV